MFLRAPPSPPARSRSYVDDLSTFQHALDEGGVPYFRRTSFFADDADDGDATEAAHLGVQVAGRLVELVGPFDSLADADGFVPWKEHECPTAHALRFRASEYSEWASAVELYDDEVVAWGARDFGRETPLFAAAHATASDPEERAALFGALGNLTDAAVSVLESSAACTVVSITWPGQIDGFEMRYVDNRLAVHGTLSPRDYDTYVDRVHETYLAETDTEFNWDHWLDQHLGLRYNAAEYDVCAPMDDTVRHRLRGDAVGDGATGTPTVPLAKRRSLEYIDTGELNCASRAARAAAAPRRALEPPTVTRRATLSPHPLAARASKTRADTTHYYTAFHGVLTWEFNVQCAEDAHAPDVCACVADNNDETFAGLSRDNEQCFERGAANATVLHRAGANQTTAALGGGGPDEGHAIEHDDAAPASDAAAEMAPQMAVLPPIARDAARTAPGGYPWERLCHESCNATGCHEECDRSADAKPGASLNRSMNFSR